MSFIKIQPEQLHGDCFTMIGKEWMLVSAEKGGIVNTMTASWGGMGILWNKKVAFVFIRPQRYTKQFVDTAGKLSLCFFDEAWRQQLRYLGTVSGKEEPKIEKAGLHIAREQAIPYFKEAITVLLGNVLYAQEMSSSCFLDPSLIEKNYPLKDFHTMYVVEIETVLAQAD